MQKARRCKKERSLKVDALKDCWVLLCLSAVSYFSIFVFTDISSLIYLLMLVLMLKICQSIISTKQTLFFVLVKYCALLLLRRVRIRKMN